MGDLFRRIRERPGMYLGECSLTALYHTIAGYEWALHKHGVKDDVSLRLPADFNDWVAYRLHLKESTPGWKRMLLSACTGEQHAFERFFELLDDHAVRKARIIATANGLENHTMRSSGGEKVERYPKSISLISYTDDPGFFAQSDEPGYSLPIDGFFPSLKWLEAFTGIPRSKLIIIDAHAFDQCTRNTE